MKVLFFFCMWLNIPIGNNWCCLSASVTSRKRFPVNKSYINYDNVDNKDDNSDNDGSGNNED